MHGNGFSDVRRRDSLADVLAGRTEGNCASEIPSGQREGEKVLKILKTGYSAKLRHFSRVHKVNLASMTETLEDPE